MLVKPGLYIVSTPIGNLDDITLRALDALKSSDIIICEDTRVSRKLLAKHNIDSALLVYNDKSNEIAREKLAQRVKNGEVICLISDAGTPLISDPGFKLVKYFYQHDLHVDIIPGVSAPIAALTLSGLPSDSFFFGGFLPKTTEQRKKKFDSLSKYESTLIFFDTASRIADSLIDAKDILGNRQAVVARELTKMFQERISGTLDFLASHFKENPTKGEIVFLISGEGSEIVELEDLENQMNAMLRAQHSARDIADQLFEQSSSKAKGYPTRSEIYKHVNLIKKQLEK